MIEKEYRIVLPVSVEEYRCAQVYMTAQTSLAEAENVDGAGVEVLVNRPGKHPKLGAAQYTKKKFHIDKRFPSWLRMVAPKSGSHLIEESWNAFPHTLTEVTFPVLSSFRITVESHHRPDRGEGNPHGIDATARKHCEVVEIDIALPSSSSTKDQDSSTHRGDDSEEDLSLFRSQCGRGPLRGQWRKVVQPVMCAYKRVTCEIQLWGMQNKIENFMHTYEKALFHKANRNTFCWIDEWYGLGMDELRAFETAVNERINLITEIKLEHGDHRCAARVNKLPPLRAVDFKRHQSDNDQKGIQPSHEMGGPSGDAGTSHADAVVWPEGQPHVLHNMQARAEGAAVRSLFRRNKGRLSRVSDDSATADAMSKDECNERKARSVSPAALARTSTAKGTEAQTRTGCADRPDSSQVSDLNTSSDTFSKGERHAHALKNGIVVTPSKTKAQFTSELQHGPTMREATHCRPQSGKGKEENRPCPDELRRQAQHGARIEHRVSIDAFKPDKGPTTEQTGEHKEALVRPKRLGTAVSEVGHTIIHAPKACTSQCVAVALADARALGPCTSSPELHLREPIGGKRDVQVNENGEEVKTESRGLLEADPQQGNSLGEISVEEQVCGCGILFEIFESQLRISHLVDGGSASASGMLEVGDILTSINMQDVTHLDVCQIAPLLLGPEGSSVALGFQRIDAGADVVVLQRRPYPTTLLSDHSRASPLGRKRILSLRGVSRKNSGSDSNDSLNATPVSYATSRSTPTRTATPMAETPSSGGIGGSNCEGTAALSSDQGLFLGDTALRKFDDCVRVSNPAEPQTQQLDQDLCPQAGAGSTARSSVEAVRPSKSSLFRNVVRWNRDQRAPKRREEKCSIAECCKVCQLVMASLFSWRPSCKTVPNYTHGLDVHLTWCAMCFVLGPGGHVQVRHRQSGNEGVLRTMQAYTSSACT
jgi:hypothetical protein